MIDKTKDLDMIKTTDETKEKGFIMPECKFCATCGSCRYYEQYGFGKAYCNYHGRDTSSSDPACGAYS